MPQKFLYSEIVIKAFNRSYQHFWRYKCNGKNFVPIFLRYFDILSGERLLTFYSVFIFFYFFFFFFFFCKIEDSLLSSANKILCKYVQVQALDQFCYDFHCHFFKMFRKQACVNVSRNDCCGKFQSQMFDRVLNTSLLSKTNILQF